MRSATLGRDCVNPAVRTETYFGRRRIRRMTCAFYSMGESAKNDRPHLPGSVRPSAARHQHQLGLVRCQCAPTPPKRRPCGAISAQIARKMSVGLSKSHTGEGAEAMRRLEPADPDAELVREWPSSSISEGREIAFRVGTHIATIATGCRRGGKSLQSSLAWGDSLVTLAFVSPTQECACALVGPGVL